VRSGVWRIGLEIHINLEERTDLRGQIYRQLRAAILGGALKPGTVLPSSRDLADQLDVSRATVIIAYDRLADEGYVEARVGAGTFVSFAPTQIPHHLPVPSNALKARDVWSQIDRVEKRKPGIRYFFRTGIPDLALFPHTLWRRLITRALRTKAWEMGTYGAPDGHAALRVAIARHIAVARGVTTTPDNVTVTNGTQQAIDLVARVLLEPGDVIAVEDPGYQPPNRLFRSMGLTVIGVPVDADGLVVDALPATARLVYVTPSHQYPLGVTMSMPRRQALLAWADRFNVAIIEDDYDSEFRFDGRPLETLQALDTKGRVIYIGSFSKSLQPALRLGFIVTPASLRDAVQKAKQVADWHSSTLAQAALALMIDEGEFARHIRRVRSVYQERHAMIRERLLSDFADAFTPVPSVAGLHIAATARHLLPGQIDALRRYAQQQGVEIHSLSEFAAEALPHSGIVLGYGAIATADIDDGLSELRQCLDSHTNNRASAND